jgi:ATP-binding cassette subfamily F protein uup
LAVLLTATGLTKAFGSRPLFEGITCSLDSGDRVGLIGPNGAGKSTLLALLAGELPPDEGLVSRRTGVRVGFLSQIPRFREGATIEETVLEGAQHRTNEETWQAELAAEETMARLSLTSDGLAKTTNVATLSGGWKKRVALARELVRAPDLLLLDEPTNHLDVDAILWLEELLARARFATLTVTHDRAFLQRVATRILELDRRNPGGLLDVRGSYADYVAEKEARLAAAERLEASLANRLRREKEWLLRGAKARTTKQQARIQRADALAEEVADLRARNASRGLAIDFDALERSPKRLIEAKGIAKSHGGRVLFHGADLLVTPASRIGLIGPNGCGKSTLLRVLLGAEAPDAGEIVRSDALRPVVFEQGRESLDPDASVAETLHPHGDHVEYRGAMVHIRGYLERFLFRPEQHGMAVGKLSGGEQSRLLLARLMLVTTNLLVLDEPTNDLDLQTLDVLEECLAEFPGAVLLVSHDRWFLDRVTNRILAFGKDEAGRGTITELAGLDQWEAWRRERDADAPEKARAAATLSREDARPKRRGYLEQRELEGMEARIQAAEAARDALRAETESPENASDAGKLVELLRALEEKQAEVDRLYARWAELEG